MLGVGWLQCALRFPSSRELYSLTRQDVEGGAGAVGRGRYEAQRLGNLAALPHEVSELGVEPILPLFLDLCLFPSFSFPEHL